MPTAERVCHHQDKCCVRNDSETHEPRNVGKRDSFPALTTKASLRNVSVNKFVFNHKCVCFFFLFL